MSDVTTELTPEQRYRHIVVSSLHNWFDPDPANHWAPHPSQQIVLEAIFKNDCKLVFCQCGRKWGKDISLDTLIATPDRGFVPLRELKEGDLIFGDDGMSTKIIGLSEIRIPKTYEVHFSDGSKIVASDTHRWETSTKLERRKGKRSRSCHHAVRTTVEIKNSLTHGKEWNHSIPVAKALHLKTKELLLHPYVLGVWLGDGSSASASITGIDEEIFQQLESYGFPSTQYRNTQTKKVPGLFSYLRQMRLIKNKHVPLEYLWGDFDQRLFLLQGLMDTDGTIGANGQCCFDNTNENLSNAVHHLVCSLGMQTKRTSRKGKLNGKEFKTVHRVYFYPELPVFRLSRKACRVRPRRKPNHRFIVDVNPISSVASRCIAVDNKSHLYLAGESFVPTHNTEVIVYSLWRWSLLTPGQSCYYICPEFKQAKEIIWKSRDRKGRLRIQEFGPSDFIESIDNTELRINFKNGSFIKIDGSDNFDSWAGISPHFVVLDEFRSFKPQFYGVMNPNRATFNAPQIIIGTPPEQIWLDKDTMHQYCEVAHYARLDMLKTGNSFHIKRASWDNPDPMIHAFLRTEKDRLWQLNKKAEWWREYGAELVSGGESKVFPRFIADSTIPNSHVLPHSNILDLMYH